MTKSVKSIPNYMAGRMKEVESMNEKQDTPHNTQRLMSRDEVVLNMYTSIANGESQEIACKELQDWNEQKSQERKDSVILC